MRLVYITFVFICYFLPISAQQGTKNFIDQNYIEVTGTAEMEVIPDLIYLHIVISEKDKKGNKSVELQESQLMRELKEIGIDIENKISVISYSSTYIRYFFKKNDVEKTKEYELLLTKASDIAPVYSKLDELDVSNISIAKLDHSKMDSLKQDTKIEAIKAAKEKASLYTKTIGQSIGRALHILEQNALISQHALLGTNTNILIRGYASKSLEKQAIKNPINLKKIHINASVLTRFELQ